MNKLLKRLLLWSCSIYLLAGIGRADWYVSSDGDDSSGGTSWETAFATISKGISQAAEGDTVWISAGTYEISAQLSVTKAINLYGKPGEEIIIDAQNSGARCLYMNAAAKTAVISNLTFTGGNGSGAGIMMYGGTIVDCVFSNNNGGGVLHYYHPAVFSNCLFIENTAVSAAGLYVVSATNVTVVGCDFLRNQADSEAGLRLSGEKITVKDCNFIGNEAIGTSYGGLYTTASEVSIYGNTFVSNRAEARGGAAGLTGSGVFSNNYVAHNIALTDSGGVRVGSGGVTITHCDFISNQVPTLGTDRDAGGLYLYGADAKVYNSRFIGNHAGQDGGALVPRGVGVLVQNCLLYNNTAGRYGAGIRIGAGDGVNTKLVNCTIVSNVASGYAGIWGSSGYAYTSINCIVYYNTTPSGTPSDWHTLDPNVEFLNNCTSTAITGNRCSGNITDEPLFLDLSAGDYRLADTSPCINQGFNQAWMKTDIDFDGRPRLDRFSGLVDMGCYEYVPQGAMFRLR